MLRCKLAARVLIGAFVNFSAICRDLAEEQEIVLLCEAPTAMSPAKTRSSPALSPMIWRGHRDLMLNDQAEIAADAWRTAVRMLTDRPLGLTLRDSRGGRNLIEIGQENDIYLAAQLDQFDVVPTLVLADWAVRLPDAD